MSHQFRDPALAESQIDELLEDLELRCRTDVTAAREMNSLHCRVGVTIRPGNASERGQSVAQAETVELRSQGMTCLAAAPVAVGDVHHLTFDRNSSDIEPLLAVCDRCTMLGDASFEARFRFVHQVALPAQNNDQA